VHLLWPDLPKDLEQLLQWKIDPKGPRGYFFGLRAHPKHEICRACKQVVDLPRDRKCPKCGALNGNRNPWIQRHNGLDLPKGEGTAVCAPWDGVVMKVWFDPKLQDGGHGGGNSLYMKYIDGPWSAGGYCHLSQTKATVKQKVEAGDILGYVGRTGDVTGPHLHLTAYGAQKEYVDPFPDLLMGAQIVEIPWHFVG